MTNREVQEYLKNGDYVVTVSIFPGSMAGQMVGIVLSPETWATLNEQDLAERYFYPAIALLKEKTK